MCCVAHDACLTACRSAGEGRCAMPAAIVDLAVKTASAPALGLDLDRHLGETCRALVRLLDITAAEVFVLDPAVVHGSDTSAVLLGEAHEGASVGPVANALLSGRP